MNGEPGHLPPRARIGHVNLKVADLERSLAFYRDVLGFKITKRIGDTAAFLACGDYHHDICINTWEKSRRGTARRGHDGIVPSRDRLFPAERIARCVHAIERGGN